MLQLKIGNTYVDTLNIQIPVVYRNPLLSDGKGSYLFNFNLPATDKLKKEFEYFHRPGRSGSRSIKRTLELTFGPLKFSGYATVSEAGYTSYEVSCPIDNGELARMFKEKKLSDIDLGGVRDTNVGKTNVDAKPSEDLVVDISSLDPPIIRYQYLLFDNILSNPDQMINSIGDTILIGETNQWVFIYNIEVKTFDYGDIYLEIFKGSNLILQRQLKIGFNSIPIEIDAEIYDSITWRIKGICLQIDNPGQAPDVLKLKYTIDHEMSWIKVFENTILNNNNGLSVYPYEDYACFPFENAKMFDNLEDDFYKLDHTSIKEIYSKYFPVFNYYKDNRFPTLLYGVSEGEAFVAFNLFNPFPYLAYVIKQIAKEFGTTIENNVFEEPDQKQLVIFNLFAENGLITSDLIQPKPGFNLQDHVPDMLISKFWINLCRLLGIGFDYNASKKTLRLKYLKDIAASTDYKVFPGTINSKPLLKSDAYNGYRLIQNITNDEFISKYFRRIDGLVLKGTVNTLNELSGVENPLVNDCWHVKSRKEYYYWNYDPELSILNWVFFSKDFFFVKEEINSEFGNSTYEIQTDISAVMDNGWPFTDNNICAPAGRFWLIPKVQQTGNFDGLPDVFRSEFSKSLLFFHGLRFDNQEMLYPLGSSDIYDYYGNPITFEASSNSPAYTHSLSLRWDGPNGIYEKRYKKWIDLLVNSRGFFTIRCSMSVLQLSQLDWFEWYTGPGYKFMVKEARFNIYNDHLSVVEMDILVK